ncbi:hypothetical protein Q669_10925 [Labrenzia sp. C1B10]|uniref:DUF3800 domain-containing protein n=1 Tax=unclassified Labrenzia TaxID=2648686 RepID=UPI0003B85846|nr:MULTISPECIES: DUF3800 domain-containing protein [unclassified Labrenzia]ERP87269.1 hypothetical protein Q669_10925 [Labrenzia sp. C1B10]ERS07573.1 hypothetical protein Q675_19560 [Labrenzia sp. C1B70]
MTIAPVYRLYVDEHGTDTLKNLGHPNNRYLSLTGVAMRIDHARDFLTKELIRIKADVLNDDPDNPAILHLSDIRQRKGPFGKLNNDAVLSRFNSEITKWMRSTECTVITTIIDKKWMVEQKHWKQNHPYHYLAEILFEKYTQFLERKKSLGDIMPEARDKPLNKALQKEFDRVRLKGSRYASAAQICRRIPVSKLKFMEKYRNVAGLQLCDIFTYPSHYIARSFLDCNFKPNEFHKAIGQILLEDKYDRSRWNGEIVGYGIKCLP